MIFCSALHRSTQHWIEFNSKHYSLGDQQISGNSD